VRGRKKVGKSRKSFEGGWIILSQNRGGAELRTVDFWKLEDDVDRSGKEGAEMPSWAALKSRDVFGWYSSSYELIRAQI
jgi:hypothetical protein